MTASTLKSGQAVSFETVTYFLDQDKLRVRMPVRQSPGYHKYICDTVQETKAPELRYFRKSADREATEEAPDQNETDKTQRAPKTQDGWWRHPKTDAILANNNDNVRQALATLGYRLHYDEFANQVIIEGERERTVFMRDGKPIRMKDQVLETDEITGIENNDNFQILSDDIQRRVWFEIETEFGFRPTKEFFFEVVMNEARKNTFHPVRDFLEQRQAEYVPVPPSLDDVDDATYDAIMADDDHPHWKADDVWARKTGRTYHISIDTWLIDYCQAEDTPLNRAIGRLVLLAAVRRARDPGCKFDQIMVLEGPQGGGKSSALAALCPLREWFSDGVEMGLNGKEMMELTFGKWIIEAAEMSGMKKRDVEHIKSFASRTSDRGCLKWEKLGSERSRQFIVIGTTNDDKYLLDETGNRRFWPVKVGTIDLERLRQDVHLLWSEAAYREAQGESIVLPQELWDAAAEQAEMRMVDRPWMERLDAVLGDLDGKILQDDVWRILGLDPSRMQRHHSSDLNKVMEKLGFEKKKQIRFVINDIDQRAAGYVRGKVDDAPRIYIGQRTEDNGNRMYWVASNAPVGVDGTLPEMPY